MDLDQLNREHVLRMEAYLSMAGVFAQTCKVCSRFSYSPSFLSSSVPRVNLGHLCRHIVEDEGTAEIGFYGTEYNLNDALWCCQNMFARVRTKVSLCSGQSLASLLRRNG
jgi:hypothetical protein